MHFLEKNWALISATATLAGVVGAFIWMVASIYYSGQVATAKGEATLGEK